MSNKECSDLYERIINDVIQESRQDFEDSGIDEQTLLDLRRLWRDRLSKTKVANFSWDAHKTTGDALSDEEEDSAALSTQQFQDDYQGGGGAVNGSDGGDLGVHGLHLPQSDLALPISLPKQEDTNTLSGIVLPGGSTIGQADGPIDIEFTIDTRSIPNGLKRQLLLKKNQKRLQKQKQKRSESSVLDQTDGNGLGESSDDDDDDEDLGSDLGIDSDEINSDLDDPEDDDVNSEEDNDDPETNIMLCLYDRVQRVKNKWKCNLKDGIANIEGKDYAFQKATGDSEW